MVDFYWETKLSQWKSIHSKWFSRVPQSIRGKSVQGFLRLYIYIYKWKANILVTRLETSDQDQFNLIRTGKNGTISSSTCIKDFLNKRKILKFSFFLFSLFLCYSIQGLGIFVCSFLIDILPLRSGSVDPNFFADPNPGSQNIAGHFCSNPHWIRSVIKT